MKNNIDLVKHCERASIGHWGYVWGTFGKVLTEKLLQQKLKQYPTNVGKYETHIRANWLNGKTADCIGLIKSYLWEENGVVKYDPSTDLNVGMMLDRCKEKGKIDTIPELPGVLVFKKGHVGVYIGDGKVIEANSTLLGVIQTPLKGGTPWTDWGKCPYIEYDEAKDDITGHWAEESIRKVLDAGLMSGYPDGTFKPDEPLTRAQYAYMKAKELRL